MAKSVFSPNRAAKLLISLVFFPLACGYDLVRRLFHSDSHPHGTILYYHAIPAQHRQHFAKQMDALICLTTPVKIDSDWPFEAGVRYSGVTFDDGFRSVRENALPELEKRNIPATIFVTAEGLGKRPAYWPQSAHYESNEEVLSAEELRELPQDLITIGSHTVTHPFLPSLSVEDSKREIFHSRVMLQELLHRKIRLFSFPFGAYSEELIGYCREAGYDRIFTTVPTVAFRDPQEYVSGRVPAEPTDSLLEFRLKVLGAYRWLPLALALKKKVKRIFTRKAQPSDSPRVESQVTM